MTPLYIFLETTKSLAKKPIDFWSSTEKQKALKNLATAINKLEGILESKKLTNTHAYKQLKGLEKTVSTSGLNEVLFIQSLNGLVDIYKHAPANNKIDELVTLLDVAVSRTKPKILEHHLLLERQEQKAQKMSQGEQDKKDREIIQKIGIFYVLEYTLQALYAFTVINDDHKKRLLKEGLKTKAGNLPAYLPLEDTLRKELCYALFDKQLRNELLAIRVNRFNNLTRASF
ncbi:MAG: hypothetical protein NUV84_00915 [Candidatus Uhrbacteria bacterium]|nr:hypothetical protein [Candidatus Uhrbacteria bacterium]